MISILNKKLYFGLGIIFMGIGTLGYVLPVLPGTVFMIIAAYCFLNSSDKLYSRIVTHPSYGKSIKNYIEFNKIPRSSKIVILVSMWTATFISAFIAPTYILKSIVVVLALIGSFVVLNTND